MAGWALWLGIADWHPAAAVRVTRPVPGLAGPSAGPAIKVHGPGVWVLGPDVSLAQGPGEETLLAVRTAVLLTMLVVLDVFDDGRLDLLPYGRCPLTQVPPPAMAAIPLVLFPEAESYGG